MKFKAVVPEYNLASWSLQESNIGRNARIEFVITHNDTADW